MARKLATISYRTHAYKVLKKVTPGMGLTKRGMSVVNDLLNMFADTISTEAHRIAKLDGRKTIADKHIICAFRQVFPGELGKHASSEASKAVTRFAQSKSE